MDVLYIEIGKRIREHRKSANLSQGDLASAIGLSRTSIANIERGFQETPLKKLYDIAYALNVKIYEILPGDIRADEVWRVNELRKVDSQIAELMEKQNRLRR